MFATSRISVVILVSRVNSANPDICQNFCLAIWFFFRIQIVGLGPHMKVGITGMVGYVYVGLGLVLELGPG